MFVKLQNEIAFIDTYVCTYTYIYTTYLYWHKMQKNFLFDVLMKWHNKLY